MFLLFCCAFHSYLENITAMLKCSKVVVFVIHLYLEVVIITSEISHQKYPQECYVVNRESQPELVMP